MDEVSGLEQLESIINFEKLTEWTSSNVSRAENLLQLLSKLSIPSTPPTVFNEQSPTQFHPT